jgi:hypothetical protein
VLIVDGGFEWGDCPAPDRQALRTGESGVVDKCLLTVEVGEYSFNERTGVMTCRVHQHSSVIHADKLVT